MPRTLFRRAASRLVRSLRPNPIRLVYSPRYSFELPDLPQDPRRSEYILTFLASEGLISRGQLRWARPATLAALGRVHTSEYLDRIEQPASALEILGAPVQEGDVDRFLAAQRAMVGGTMLATRLALENRSIALHLGGGLHHARADRGRGFCAFNDLAIAIAQARADGFTAPILVVDLDLHDGDGTRTLFANDSSVHTFSIHNQTWDDAPAVESTTLELGARVTDDAFLDCLRRSLPPLIERFRPGLVLYVAGCDGAADDALGNWRLSPRCLLARDQLVIETLRRGRNIPLVVTLAGGYGRNAWRYSARFFAWLLSGGEEVEPPSTTDITLLRARYIAKLVSPSELTRQPGENALGISSEDLLPTGRAPSRARFLGYYSHHGLELALERYGLLARLRALGFPQPTIELGLENPTGDTLRIFSDEDRRELLVELRLRKDLKLMPGFGLLFIEWLLLQNPRASFSPERPALPGQQHPGLGTLREVIALIIVACERLELDGLAFTPSHYHLAVQAVPGCRFADPEHERRFRAVQAAVSDLSLQEASVAIAAGRVRNVATGVPFVWQPAPIVLPVSQRLRKALESMSAEPTAGPRFECIPG